MINGRVKVTATVWIWSGLALGYVLELGLGLATC